MPVSIDFPRERPKSGQRRTVVAILVVIAIVVFSSRNALSYWVDLLWFQSLGYGDVDGHERGGGLAVAEDQDPLPTVLRVVDKLGQVGFGVGEGGLSHDDQS